MAWKSRMGRLPPPDFYALIMAYLAEAFPSASITPSALHELKPIWDELWLNGRSPEIIAKTTCSCDGKTITGSPVLGIPKLQKGAVRGPLNTKRGVLFDPTQLRESTAAEELKRRRTKLDKELALLTTQAGTLQARASKTRDQGARTTLTAEVAKRQAMRQQRYDEAVQIQQQLTELRKQLAGVARLLSAEESPPIAPTATPSVAPQPKPAKPQTSAAAPRAERKPKPAKAEKPAAPEATSAEADAALLSRVTELLPGIAEKIAASLAKKA